MGIFDNSMDHVKFLIKNGGITKLFDHFKENVLFDLTHGTDTSAWLEKRRFKIHPKNFKFGVRYRASATNEIKASLNKISGIIDTSDSIFFDLGCGKGKVICIAGLQYDFKDIIGIDYYQPFLDQAQKNLDICKLDNAKITLNDMADFKDFAENSVVFLYNPANEVVIDKVRQNIENNSKKAIIIYNKPEHESVFKGWNVISKNTSADPDHCTTILSYGI